MTMAGAIKQITIERGLDPRDFTLFAFGGGGPLHSAQIARELAIPCVIVPPEPGIFSALGMILADARVDEVRTYLGDLTPATMAEVEALFAAMEQAMREKLAQELDKPTIRFERQADLRFHGQRHTLRTPLGDARDAAGIRRAFETTYERKFGHVEVESPIEFVGLALTGFARIERPALEGLRPVAPEAGPAAPRRREVHFGEAGRIMTPVLSRGGLPVGHKAAGPAIIEEYGSTTVVWPSDRFEIGELGEIRIYCE
jgi:N-methylhydantoinase A